jgi:hypothetical protein
MTGLRRLLRDAWAIARPYWFSEDRWAARGLLLVVVALTLGIVYINVLLNQWNNTFYNALQDKDYAVFVHQLIVSPGSRDCTSSRPSTSSISPRCSRSAGGAGSPSTTSTPG